MTTTAYREKDRTISSRYVYLHPNLTSKLTKIEELETLNDQNRQFFLN